MKQEALVYYEILRQITGMVGNVGLWNDPNVNVGFAGSLFSHQNDIHAKVNLIRGTDLQDATKGALDWGANTTGLFQVLRFVRNMLMTAGTNFSRIGDSSDAAADMDGTADRSIFAGLRYLRNLITTALGAGGVRTSSVILLNAGSDSGNNDLWTANGDVGLMAVSVRHGTGALSVKYTSQALTACAGVLSILTDLETTFAILNGTHKQALGTFEGGGLDIPNGQKISTDISGADNTETVTFTYRAYWIPLTVGAYLA